MTTWFSQLSNITSTWFLQALQDQLVQWAATTQIAKYSNGKVNDAAEIYSRVNAAEELGKETEKIAIILDNRARLMFYLDCIGTVVIIKPDENIQKFRDYRNSELDWEQTSKLLNVCISAEPKFFLDKCIFENAAMCRDDEQRFHDIKDVKVIPL